VWGSCCLGQTEGTW